MPLKLDCRSGAANPGEMAKPVRTAPFLPRSGRTAFVSTHLEDLHDLVTELIVWLVRNHLVMSQVAQKEDLTDPDVITNFSRLVGDVRHLSALYLLTHADIRGTSPKVWNQWKGKLLADLYYQTLHHLSQGEAPAPHGIIAERQAEAMRLLRFFALSDTVHERLWKQLDTVYFLRHSAEEIAWHTRALHYRISNNKPVVRARLHQEGEDLQVMVYTQDQPDLFGRIVGFFARAGYSIVDAKIHTTAHGYALDSFVLLHPGDDTSYRDLIALLEHELMQQLQPGAPLPRPPRGRLSRQVKHFPIAPQVSIRAISAHMASTISRSVMLHLPPDSIQTPCAALPKKMTTCRLPSGSQWSDGEARGKRACRMALLSPPN